MGPKLLFILGIVVTHAAVGAVLMRQESPVATVPVSSCTQPAGPMPWFGQQREMLAMQVVPIAEEAEVARP